LYGIFCFTGDSGKQLKDYTVLHLEEVKRIIFVNLKALRALVISAYDVDCTYHRIIQKTQTIIISHTLRLNIPEPKIKCLSEENIQALYSNLQIDLSRGIFPYALPFKILQNLAPFPCMLHLTKI
jgi:hypothetical protein